MRRTKHPLDHPALSKHAAPKVIEMKAFGTNRPAGVNANMDKGYELGKHVQNTCDDVDQCPVCARCAL